MSVPDPVRLFARWLLGRGLAVVFLIVAAGLLVGSRGQPLLLVAGAVCFVLAFRYHVWAETRELSDR